MGALQPLHLLLILVIVLVIFGAGRLGEVGSALGKGVRDFRANVEDKDKAAPTTAPTASFCPNCGTRTTATGQRFCQQCGASLPGSG